MIDIDDLLELADMLGIKISFRYLNRKRKRELLAFTVSRFKTIILDHSILNDLPKLKSVLSEEIGHILHPPRPGHIRYHSRRFYQRDDCSMIKYNVAQDERKALDWATGVLMPNVEFNRFMENGGYSISEIAEHFEVETWLVEHKIGYYRRKQFENYGRRVKWRELIRRV